MNDETTSKKITEEGYIIYSKEDDYAIEIMDKRKEMFSWTNKPAYYKIYKTETEALEDIKYARNSIEESLRYLRHIYAEDDLPVINAKMNINILTNVGIYKVYKSIIVDIGDNIINEFTRVI